MSQETPAAQPPPVDAPADQAMGNLKVERYKFILSQMASANEYSYKFLGLYQTLTTAIVGAAIALMVGYKKWEISPAIARASSTGLLILQTIVATFTILLLIAGIASWYDYRTEECDLIDSEVGRNFRARPRLANFWRWYETYFIVAIAATTIALWILLHLYVLSAIS